MGVEGALGSVPAKLHPIFRDRTDLQAGGHINQSLQSALEASEALVVLCTPTSAKSHWVNHECETFLGLGRADRIFPVIAGGEPDSADPELECFPPALRGRGILAADLREVRKPNGQLIGDGREGGRLKLIAGLLGLPLDALARRERRRQRTLAFGALAAASVFALVAAAAGWFGWQAETQRREAFATLTRFFNERGQAAARAGNIPQAMRYALAGFRLSPENEALFRATLAGALFRAGDSRVLARTDSLEDLQMSASGTIAMLRSNGVVRIYDMQTSANLFEFGSPESRARVYEAVLSRDGSLVALNHSYPYRLMVRDIGGQRDLREVTSDAYGGPVPLSFDHRGARLAVREGEILVVYDIDSGAVLSRATPCEQDSDEFSATWLAHGDNILVNCKGGGILLIDAMTGAIARRLAPYRNPSEDVHVHADEAGRFVAVATDGINVERTMRLWDLSASGAAFEAPFRLIEDVDITPDGSFVLAYSTYEPHVSVWRTRDRERIVDIDIPVSDRGNVLLNEARFNAAGDRFLVALTDGTIRIHDVSDGHLLSEINASTDSLSYVQFAGADIVAAATRALRVWRGGANRLTEWYRFGGTYRNNLRDGTLACGYPVITRRGNDDQPEVYALRNESAWSAIAVVGRTPMLANDCSHYALVHNDGTGFQVGTLERGVRAQVIPGSFQAFSADGARVAVYDEGQPIFRVVDSRTGATIASAGTEATQYDSWIRRAAFSPSGRLVAFTVPGDTRVLDLNTGDVSATLATPLNSVWSLAISADEQWLALGGHDEDAKSVYLWRLSDQSIVRTFNTNGSITDNVAISPNAQLVATSSDAPDGDIRIWDLPTGLLLATFDIPDRVGKIEFSRDGSSLTAFSEYDGRVYVWDVSVLSMPMSDLANIACSQALLPTSTDRTFSANELAADSLLREMWQLNGSRGSRDVCEDRRAPGLWPDPPSRPVHQTEPPGP
jgi:WD40 repeat protein